MYKLDQLILLTKIGAKVGSRVVDFVERRCFFVIHTHTPVLLFLNLAPYPSIPKWLLLWNCLNLWTDGEIVRIIKDTLIE